MQEIINIAKTNLETGLGWLQSNLETNTEVVVTAVIVIIIFVGFLAIKEIFDILRGSNKSTLKEKIAELKGNKSFLVEQIGRLSGVNRSLEDSKYKLEETISNMSEINFEKMFTPDILRAIVEMQEENKSNGKFIVKANMDLSKSPELSDSAIEELTKNISSAEKDLKVVDDFIGKKPTGGFHESNDI